MIEQELQILYWENVDTMNGISELLSAIRIQNRRMSLECMSRTTRQLMAVLQTIVTCYDDLYQLGLPWDLEYFQSVLSQIEEAQQVQDDILVGDLYELLMLPALQDVQNAIRSAGISLQMSTWFKDNLKVLEAKNQNLYQALQNYNVDRTEQESETQYHIEPTSTGSYTMALEEGGERWYLHSNRDPIEEARLLAKHIYRLEKEQYLLVGWGMGYLARELLRLDANMDLVVVEADLGILYHSLSYGDWREVLEHVKISWDPQWEQFQQWLDGNREIIIFRPELRHIKNKIIRQELTNIADRKDGIDYHTNIFYQNARDNIRYSSHYVDEIESKIKGKRVVIVAGGPSLDRNIHILEQRPDDVVLLAVGTVFRLLIQKGISPDYVIVSDCAIYKQIQGLEDITIPILLLATSDRRVSQYYKGPKYLICQKGYSLAFDYAKAHGYRLYESGGSVATLALDVAIRMKAASIAFIGLDLAYYGNRAHASGTESEIYAGYEFQQAEGVDGTMVNTSQSFVNYRKWMERRIQQADVDMRIVDATEGGVKKEGFCIMTLQEYLNE